MIASLVSRHGEPGLLSVGTRDGKGDWGGQQLVRASEAIVCVGGGGLEGWKGAFDSVTQGRWPVAKSVPVCYCARAPLPALDTRPSRRGKATLSDPCVLSQ